MCVSLDLDLPYASDVTHLFAVEVGDYLFPAESSGRRHFDSFPMFITGGDILPKKRNNTTVIIHDRHGKCSNAT